MAWGRFIRHFEKSVAGLPGLLEGVELDNVGHWVHHEASAEVSDHLVKFLRTANPSLNSQPHVPQITNHIL